MKIIFLKLYIFIDLFTYKNNKNEKTANDIRRINKSKKNYKFNYR